ncbi:hypothetical protein LUZ61_020656 [Rhynchospora tenuis]|uniref:F-box domain-containing protein n=1 Tax=Rhynchospora tenuis TaxID=198213 RepID=A0AAD5ZDD9_9POAL|nr:hypothetical protein LUZ61_020656 [Rhynchospora tenuis]
MSNLPEELFLDIMRLSSMKARAAVKMCLLSKRWNHLWEVLPDLNFDLGEFYSEDHKQYGQRFFHFVNTMLERRKTDALDKFRLSCFDLCDKRHCSSIERWILYAIQHKVRVVELEVCVWSIRRVLTQRNIPCDSIEELHLRLDFMHASDQCGDMPSLTHATLALLTDRFNLYSLDTTLENLSSVENLELCASKIKAKSESPSYDLTVYNLKKLSICLHGFEYFPCIWESLPNLEKLTLWTFCQHSFQHYNEILNWDEELQNALMECKMLKTVEVVSSTLDDKKKQLVDDLCQLGDVKIVISNRGYPSKKAYPAETSN